MARLCALLRAIIMKLNSLDAKRNRMKRVHRYLSAIFTAFEKVRVDENRNVIIEVGYDTKYAITPTGKVLKARGRKLQELTELEELEAIKKLEEYVLEKAKSVAERIGINVDKVLNPPKKPKPKSKPKTQRKRKAKKEIIEANF